MSTYSIISLRPQNFIRQLPWRVGSKAALGFILLLAVFSLVGWLYLTDASRITTTSYRIDELRLELDHVRNENATLILEIAELKALSRVERRAFELGFRPAERVEYLRVNDFPALLETNTKDVYDIDYEEHSVDAFIEDLEAPSWWEVKLDQIAAWLEGRDTSNYVRPVAGE